MAHATQMAAARQGVLTAQMQQVLKDETIHEDDLIARIAEGRIVIPANRNHPNLVAKGIGAGLTTKINVNLGVSEDCCNVENELGKVRRSIELKADAIMDLSTFGDTRAFRRRTVEISPVMIGTVPIYDAVARYGKDVASISIDDFFDVVRIHAEDGVDFMTIHAGLTQTAVELGSDFVGYVLITSPQPSDWPAATCRPLPMTPTPVVLPLLVSAAAPVACGPRRTVRSMRSVKIICTSAACA